MPTLEEYEANLDHHMGESLSVKLANSVKGLKSAKEIAEALAKAMKEEIAAQGMKPDIEGFIHDPAKSKSHVGYENWHVCWESGPYEWASAASWKINEVLEKNGSKFHVEPYWSFSLMVCE